MSSNFNSDLNKEHILGKYLDHIYLKLNFNFSRENQLKNQLNGIDLTIINKNETYIIDEKAQLYYLNKDLPTFTFELSYLKQGKFKTGWLFSHSKNTDYYFLITGIHVKSNELNSENDIISCKITSVNRIKLIAFLESLNLSQERLNEYDFDIRNLGIFGKTTIKELNKKQGCLYFSNQLEEQPMNVQLRLQHLIEIKVAKQIYPT
jgi:hypothetical protein